MGDTSFPSNHCRACQCGEQERQLFKLLSAGRDLQELFGDKRFETAGLAGFWMRKGQDLGVQSHATDGIGT